MNCGNTNEMNMRPSQLIENSPKTKSFSGLQRDSNPWPLLSFGDTAKKGRRVKRGGGGGGGKGKGEGGEPVEKLLSPLFRPLVINLMIICQQDNCQRLVAMECK